MKQSNQHRSNPPTTLGDIEPGLAIRRLAAAIALHAERSSVIRPQAWDSSAKPAAANPAKLAERLARLPMT